MILEVALAVTLQDLAWLAGEWQLTTAAQCIEETWTRPSANMLIGMSRTVVAGRTTAFEFVRIEARADGIYYVAQPGGRPPVDFKGDNGGKAFSEDYAYHRPGSSPGCGAP